MQTRNQRTRVAIAKKVQKKSKKSNGDDGMLKVRTPKDTESQFLAEMGIVAPDEIPSDEPDSVPLDFTGLSSRTIGAIHSRYAVRHSHALFAFAVRASRLVIFRRNARGQEARFRVLHAGEKKTDVDALMETDSRISRNRDRIAQLEAEIEILQGVVQSYEAIRNAASREMTRRSSERAQID
jgi:hypothetical protein